MVAAVKARIATVTSTPVLAVTGERLRIRMSTSECLSYDCRAPSEDVLERELQNALIRGGGRDRAEIRAVHRRYRKPELDPIEDVERFQPHLNRLLRVQAERSHQPHIDVEEAGPDECVVRHISV